MAPKEVLTKPAKTQKPWLTLRGGVLAIFLICAGLAIVWKFRPPAASPPTSPSWKASDKALLSAIRDGDHAKVQSLLDNGAYVNAHDDNGESALMQAAVNSDAQMMRLLLQHGADVNHRRPHGDLVMMLAVHDPDKVRLLLEHGARVEDRAMLLAASLPDSRPTLELLIRGGGNVHVNMGGVTALMSAAFCGDLESVRFLLEQG